MFRASRSGGLLVALAVVAAPGLAAERGPGLDRGSPPGGEAARPRQGDDALRRRLLRDAVEVLAEARGDGLGDRRAAAFGALADAQENLGDLEGARRARELAADEDGPGRGGGYSGFKDWALDLARACKTREAEQVFEEALRRRLDRGGHPPKWARPEPSWIVSDAVTLATLLMASN